MNSRRALVPIVAAAAVFALAVLLPFAGCGLPITGLPGDIDGGKSCDNAAQCDDGEACTDDLCENGVCRSTAVPDGLGPNQTAGDCKTIRCAGGVLTEENDDQDFASDGEDCTTDGCSGGKAVHAPKAAATACTSNGLAGVCDASGACQVKCVTDADCDDKNPCTTDACDVGVSTCANTHLNGVPTPGAMQPAGDCHSRVCVDGVDLDSPDDSDLPVVTECASTYCDKGVPSTPPKPLDAACGPGGGQFCDGAGECVQCNDASQCAGTSDDCRTITCTAGACGVAFTPAGTKVSGNPPQILHDCHAIVCDGAGNVSANAAVDDLDLPDDLDDCTDDVCTGGAISHADHAVGSPCGNGQACAAGGLCGCTNDGQCTAPSTCGGGPVGMQIPFACGCTPKSCAQLKATCGVVTDGCAGAQSCDSGTKNGAETDVDCGGGGDCATKCAQGKICGADADCASGYCVDGVCCNSACAGTCQACSAAKKGSGQDGTCQSIAQGLTDTFPASACAGTSSCDGGGACKKNLGQACGAGGECVFGNCADGYCCDTACAGTCLQCDLGGKLGSCVPVPNNGNDANGVITCDAPSFCDGAGNCKKPNGVACATSLECVGGNCVDGYCCNNTCTGTCKQCDLAGQLGTCTNVPEGGADANGVVACTGNNACDGGGNCKLTTGQPCPTGMGSACASNFCVDGYCCDSACNGACKQCNLAGAQGTCSNVPSMMTDPSCAAPNACDGAGHCLLPNGVNCNAGALCQSGFCADGKCCNASCAGTCVTCNLGGQVGTCVNVPKGSADPNGAMVCSGSKVCDGAGACKLANGQTCGPPPNDALCASGYCKPSNNHCQ